MTSQQSADAALAMWQSLRSLPPIERIEILMRDFFSPLAPCDVEYEATLRRVQEAMQ